MKVEVRPLPNQKWHGKKDKESFAQPKVIEALYSSELGGYDTGLTVEEAEEYGKKLGVTLDNKFDPENAHPFWSSKAAGIKLENFTQIFDTTKPIDFVKVKVMKASKFVANSLKEWEEGQYPDATHVIFDEEEETTNKATKIQLQTKATIHADKLSADDKAAVVQVLSNKTVRGRSNNFIDVEIAKIIAEKPEEFMRTVEMGREEVVIRGQILEMLSKNILTKEGGSVYYMGELIGIDYESTVSYFKDPNNAKMKVLILEKLNK